MKTKEELLEFAIKKRTKGCTYRAIRNCLSIDCKDDTVLQNIIEEVEDLERKRELIVKRTFPVDHSSNDKKALRNILFMVIGLVVLIVGGANSAVAIKLILVGIISVFRYA